MIDLDAIWRFHADRMGLAGQRPDFRLDPQRATDGDPATLYTVLRQQHPRIDAALAGLVIHPELRAAMEAAQEDAAHLAFELIHLGAPVDAEVSDFSGAAYLRAYPDLVAAKVDPLPHFLLYGLAEGRRTLSATRKTQYRGRRAYMAGRPTCLVVTHELSRTGAPVVALQIIREAARHHNVILAARTGGALLEACLDHVCDLVITETPLLDLANYRGPAFSRIGLAILNSVESWDYVAPLVQRDIPFVTYIHEYADYILPRTKSTLVGLFSDILVFSSEHVRDSWRDTLTDIGFDQARDSFLLPQRHAVAHPAQEDAIRAARARLSQATGRDLSTVRLVCGAGMMGWRKGTDIFAMTAQICRNRDPDTVFIWIGDGQNAEDPGFGVWMDYHLRQIARQDGAQGNLILLPAGPLYPDVLMAADALFLSSRLDPLPNVVFDALEAGCHVVHFDGATGFGDATYRAIGRISAVAYGNPEAAAQAILALPRKTPCPAPGPDSAAAPDQAQPDLFARLRDMLMTRLKAQRHFQRGSSALDVPVLFSSAEADRDARTREREKLLRYGRHYVWRDADAARAAIARSGNPAHRQFEIAPCLDRTADGIPDFSVHLHAYNIETVAQTLTGHRILQLARRIVVTTDTQAKAEVIGRTMQAAGIPPDIRLVPNRGRDILPFLDLMRAGDAAGADPDEIWCHLHEKKSLGIARNGDLWRQFLMRILLGNHDHVSNALEHAGRAEVGLVTAFDPYRMSWLASRRWLSTLAARLPTDLPEDPLLFPIGNMFWTRRSVVREMNNVFGPDYPWPNEPIASDGTEYHLIERLWPFMAARLGLRSVFLHKPDQERG